MMDVHHSKIVYNVFVRCSMKGILSRYRQTDHWNELEEDGRDHSTIFREPHDSRC